MHRGNRHAAMASLAVSLGLYKHENAPNIQNTLWLHTISQHYA